jgi:hypothetical protein
MTGIEQEHLGDSQSWTAERRRCACQRRIRLITLAAVTISIFAGTTSAYAYGASFHFESSPTWLKGEQTGKHVFVFASGVVKCSKALFTGGKVTGLSASTVVVHPKYSECVGWGWPVVVTTGCDFELSATSSTVGAMRIVCEAGAEITIEVPIAGCSIKIPGQTPSMPTVDYTDEGSGSSRSVLLGFDAGGLTYTSSGGPCGTSGAAATYMGSASTRAYGSEVFTSPHGFWVE